MVQGKGFSWVSAFLANQYHHPYHRRTAQEKECERAKERKSKKESGVFTASNVAG
jgi:hypothetical protein